MVSLLGAFLKKAIYVSIACVLLQQDSLRMLRFILLPCEQYKPPLYLCMKARSFDEAKDWLSNTREFVENSFHFLTQTARVINQLYIAAYC